MTSSPSSPLGLASIEHNDGRQRPDFGRARRDSAPTTPGGGLTAEDVCSECGERNPPNSAFCVFCGHYLGWDERDSPDDEATRIIVPPVSDHPRPSPYA